MSSDATKHIRDKLRCRPTGFRGFGAAPWEGRYLVLRRCLSEPGTWLCPLFSIPSRLDLFLHLICPKRMELRCCRFGGSLFGCEVDVQLESFWMYFTCRSVSKLSSVFPPALFLLLLLSLLCCCLWWWIPVHIPEKRDSCTFLIGRIYRL